jgi:signal transduction histidine kinase
MRGRRHFHRFICGRRAARGLPDRHRRSLQSRLFWWFGASILATALVAAAVTRLFGDDSWSREVDRVRALTADRFASVWEDPTARNELASAVARHLELRVRVLDASNHALFEAGPVCDGYYFRVPIERQAKRLGELSICAPEMHRRGRPLFLVGLLAAVLTLWAASGFIARRLARPLADLVRVTRAIGEGDLSSRARLGRHQLGEVGVLAESVNEMAARIEKQMSDQRELLAAVSHEIRSPLTRVRVLLETAREQGLSPKHLDALEREAREIDALIGDLLASSRLDFDAIRIRPLDAVELAAEALERAGIPAERLEADVTDARIEGDATLLGRALANLIENAEQHGSGLEKLRVRTSSEPVSPREGRQPQSRMARIAFEVFDRGPGFDSAMLSQAFEPFRRGDSANRSASSLGLGLSLVQRIAAAHGGRAWAENGADGGAVVGFEVSARAPRGTETA